MAIAFHSATVAAMAAAAASSLAARAAATLIGLISCCYGKKAAIKATGNGEMSSGSVRSRLERDPSFPYRRPRPLPAVRSPPTRPRFDCETNSSRVGRASKQFPRGPTCYQAFTPSGWGVRREWPHMAITMIGRGYLSYYRCADLSPSLLPVPPQYFGMPHRRS